MALVHHDLCFGCGQTNLFGLLLEVERVDAERVAGRCFIKQDHQGADRTAAHQGVIAAALCEAMALACGPRARAIALSVELTADDAPVGAFLDVEAIADDQHGPTIAATATAASEGRRSRAGQVRARSSRLAAAIARVRPTWLLDLQKHCTEMAGDDHHAASSDRAALLRHGSCVLAGGPGPRPSTRSRRPRWHRT